MIIPTRFWIALAIVAAVAANTWRLSAAVDRAESDLVTAQADNEKLTAAIADQNGYVAVWKAAAIANTARADAALAEAAKSAAARRKVQEDLEAWRRRADESECDATRRLLLEYPR